MSLSGVQESSPVVQVSSLSYLYFLNPADGKRSNKFIIDRDWVMDAWDAPRPSTSFSRCDTGRFLFFYFLINFHCFSVFWTKVCVYIIIQMKTYKIKFSFTYIIKYDVSSCIYYILKNLSSQPHSPAPRVPTIINLCSITFDTREFWFIHPNFTSPFIL